MSTSVLRRTSEKVNDFYGTNMAFIFFMSATTIFGLLQVVFYSIGNLQLNGFFIDGSSVNGTSDAVFHPVANWLLLFLSLTGCYFGFIGGILLFRGNTNFIYWQASSTGIQIFTMFIAQLWFGVILSIYYTIMHFTRFYVWKNGLLEKWNISNEVVVTSALIFFAVLFVSMILIVSQWGNAMYASSAWMTTKNQYFDAVNTSISMTASLLMLFKSRWCFAFYAVAKIFNIWNYYDAMLIVPLVQMSLFWIMDFTGFIGWSYKDEEIPVEIPFHEYINGLIEKNKK